MKRTISLLFCIVLAMTTLTACSPKLEIASFPAEKFLKQLNKPEDIIAEFEKIDLFAKMDVKDNYTKQTEYDDENDTSIVRYYDNGRLVYSDYIGYGEDMFEHHLKTDSGKKTVAYVDEGDKRYSTTLTYDNGKGLGYSVSVEGGLSKKMKYGSDFVYITAYDDSSIAKVYVNYVVNCDDNTVTPVSAVYKNEKGEFHSYYNYVLDGTDETDDELLYGLYEGGVGISGDKDMVTKLNTIEGVIDISIKLSGATRYLYNIDDNDKLHWYINAPVYLLFENETTRNAFAAKHPNGQSGEYMDFYSDDEDVYPYWMGDAVLELSSDAKISGFEHPFDVVEAEFNEARSFLLTVDESGVITELKSGAKMRWD